MRRSAYVAATTLAMLALAGCAGSPHSATTPSTSQSPSPTPTASPTAEAPDPDDPSTWVVSDDGIGPFTLDMPFTEAVATVPGMKDACGWAYFAQIGDDPNAMIAITDIDGTLDHVSLGFAGPQTAGGIGVGSTKDDVLAAYPEAVEVRRNLTYLQVGRMFFGYHDSDTDMSIVDVGVSRSGPLYEFCG